MNSQDVLVLGHNGNKALTEALLRFGFVPHVWQSMRHSLEKLKRRKFCAVLVDRQFTHADVLEFILNIRDIDAHVPVFVIGSGGDKNIDRKIIRQSHTEVLDGVHCGDELAGRLKELVKDNEKRDVPV
jgi:DNA-binding NtrC family response regulator